jgi:hypothetical protein
MQRRDGFWFRGTSVGMASLFILLGLQGCMKKHYAACEVPDGNRSGIVRYFTADDFPKTAEEADRRGDPPAGCLTQVVTAGESAQGWAMVSYPAMTYIGDAPAGKQCAANTTKCSSPGSPNGCPRLNPAVVCTNTYVNQNTGSNVNPCTCTCQPTSTGGN